PPQASLSGVLPDLLFPQVSPYIQPALCRKTAYNLHNYIFSTILLFFPQKSVYFLRLISTFFIYYYKFNLCLCSLFLFCCYESVFECINSVCHCFFFWY